MKIIEFIQTYIACGAGITLGVTLAIWRDCGREGFETLRPIHFILAVLCWPWVWWQLRPWKRRDDPPEGDG